MTNTTVALTFANRRYDSECIELVHAWDIDCVEENPSGYEETKAEAIASLGADLLRWVTVEVAVPDRDIRRFLMGEISVLFASEPMFTAGMDA